jgi:transposase
MVETLNDNFMGGSTMPRLLMVRKPTPTEFGRLNELIEEAPTPRQRRKAQALVLYYLGMNARDIAVALGVHPNTIDTDLQAFGQRGWASLQEAAPMGAPARLQEDQIREAQRIAQTAPVEWGEPYGRWSLTTLRAYLIRHHILRKISREHLRQLLKKGASTGGTSNAN